MSDAELWASWRMWLGVAVVVIAIAASLLIAILVTARRIRAEARRALAAAEQIRVNTGAIWQLQTTNEVAVQLLDTVQAIERKGAALAGSLQSEPAGRR